MRWTTKSGQRNGNRHRDSSNQDLQRSQLFSVAHLLQQFLPSRVLADGGEVDVVFEVRFVLVAEADGFV